MPHAQNLPPVSRVSLDALDQRVLGVERAVQGIETQLTSIAAEFRARSTTQWSTLASFGVLVITVAGVLGWQTLRPLERDMDRFYAATLKLTESIVPRGEHIEKWDGNKTAIANLQRQIDELSKRSGDVYTARDLLIELQREQRDLRSRVYGGDRPSARD